MKETEPPVFFREDVFVGLLAVRRLATAKPLARAWTGRAGAP
jgi:hypothetical protein